MKNILSQSVSVLLASAMLFTFAPESFVMAERPERDEVGALAELNQTLGTSMTKAEALAHCAKSENRDMCMEIGKKYHLLSPDVGKIKPILESVKKACESNRDESACRATLSNAIRELAKLEGPEVIKVAGILTTNLELIDYNEEVNSVCGRKVDETECIAKLNEVMPKLQIGMHTTNPESARIYTIMDAQLQIFTALERMNSVCGTSDMKPADCLPLIDTAIATVTSAGSVMPEPDKIQELLANLDEQKKFTNIISDTQSACSGEQAESCLDALKNAKAQLDQMRGNKAVRELAKNFEKQIADLEQEKLDKEKGEENEAKENERVEESNDNDGLKKIDEEQKSTTGGDTVLN